MFVAVPQPHGAAKFRHDPVAGGTEVFGVRHRALHPLAKHASFPVERITSRRVIIGWVVKR